MAANSIGEGSLVLGVNSTGLITGLKQANAKLTEFSKTAKEATAAIGGGSFSALLEGAGKFGTIGLLIAGSIELGKNLSGIVTRTQMFHNELERGKVLGDAWSETVGRGIEKMRKELEAISDIKGTQTGIDLQTKQLKTLEEQLSSLAPQLQKAREEALKWQSVWQKDTSVLQAFLVGEKESGLKKAEANLAELEKVYKQRFEAAQELRKGLLEIGNPAESIEATKALRLFIVEMEDGVKALTENPDIMKLEKLQQAFGFSNADIGAARLAAINKEMAIANDELEKFVKSQYNSDRNADVVALEELAEAQKFTAEQIQTANDAIFAKNDRAAQKFIRELQVDLGMIQGEFKKISEEQQLDELIKAGIDQKHIDRIKKLIEYKKQLDTPYSALKSIQAGSAADFELRNRIKFDEDKRSGMNQERLLKDMLQQLIKLNIGLSALDRPSPEI
ncbi:unnamed protein product [Gemmata massiliana]|uniref:Uncharacterized protein n=1 Tax=Gemmata massiliana TaxID=1210884 RepID=A0A6P2CZU8_9BACT|nr:hypothetical protein [Gemmata massiliana]VTR94087.1 unnamed protein product [Gemmata massiliana]